jgi:hypothetical protein
MTSKSGKESLNIVQKMYSKLFFKKGEWFKGMKDGKIYSESVSDRGYVKQYKKYPMFSSKAESVIQEHNSIRFKTDFNKDGTKNIEIEDVYTPDFPVKVGYNSIKSADYDGCLDINLTYGDERCTVPKSQRDRLIKKFDKVLKHKFEKTPEEMSTLSNEEYNKYMNKYYTTPETIAISILTSPNAINNELSSVSRALPYGVECIMSEIK